MSPSFPIPEIDPAAHLSRAELEAAWSRQPPPPRDEGRLTYLLCRLPDRTRRAPQALVLDVLDGVPGDRWSRGVLGRTDDQVSVHSDTFARLVANGQSLALFGDNLTLDLDLSEENLPPGTRLHLGEALLEVTEKAHTGCRRYRARFGAEALRFTATPERRGLRLRGLFVRVLRGGEVRVGQRVRVERPSPG